MVPQTHPVFAHLKFPPYEFQEYPKWIKDSSGEQALVNNAAEELKALKEPEPPVIAAISPSPTFEVGLADDDPEVPLKKKKKKKRPIVEEEE